MQKRPSRTDVLKVTVQADGREETGWAHGALLLRLGLLSLVFAVPILVVAWVHLTEAAHSTKATRVEQLGVRFAVTALDLLELVNLERPGIAPGAAQRRRVAGLLDAMEQQARSVPGEDVTSSVIPVRKAWLAFERAPTDRNLGNLGKRILNAISLVDDDSALSFESHALEADFQDVLTSQTAEVAQRLSAAAAVAQSPGTSRRLSVAQEISIAGDLSTAENADLNLQNDMTDAARLKSVTEPPLASVMPLYRAQQASSSALRGALEGLLDRPTTKPDVAAYSRWRRDLVRHDRLLSSELVRDLGDLLSARIAENGRTQIRVVLLALLAIVVSGAVLALIGRAAVRRERRALIRAQQESRALSAELSSQRMARALVATQAQFRAVFDHSPVGLALLDPAGKIVERNGKFDEVLGRDIETVARTAPEVRVVRGDGSISWVECDVARLESPDASNVDSIAMVRDITERKAGDERLRYAATHDSVTGLPNRTAFLERLSFILSTPRTDALDRAVLFIDLDGFKLVNDTLGHHAGDRLLQLIARRLMALERGATFIARFYGDEFGVLLDATSDTASVIRIAEEVQNAIRSPLTIDNKPVVVSSSVGIVCDISAYDLPEDVVRDADTAMYHAKSLGGNLAILFDGEMDEQRAERARAMSELRLGLERSELWVAYQPIVDLRSLAPTGFEALLRWDHPELGSISPSTFIPLAERSSAILPLGRFALREACETLAHFDRENHGMPTMEMHVNLSVPQLMDAGIISDIERVLAETGVAGERLILEITESALLEDGPRAAAVLTSLRALGIRLCIDDFGTGYSSLRYLHRFPIDVLKIDRSFVARADGDVASEPIVNMVVTLAHSLGMTVIAEGIETELQCSKIRAAGCDFGQGFLFSPPLVGVNGVRSWMMQDVLRTA